ncbi:hypothetical protein AGDE_07698 [Angomonas deanei]|nr:hypothetical protein AGDE_07698 [Angomonas deanei]|eukprot:EPY34938.1 hypothetical protein AGDE_07698 [Angomonas deanei]
MFFLRDTEKTIRAFAAQTLKAMARYVSVSGMAAHLKHKRRAEDKLLTPAVFKNYEVLILNEVIRKEILHSFRRGIVAKDTLVRHEHMASCEILGQYFASYFPSFAALYTPNVDWNFYKNINHQQPKNRLNALAYLRKEVSHMNVRDLLRVFIPFLIAAVKDFAQGKRQLPNMTEGRAKGYCDAVLLTVSTIAEHLPWDGYHRVLTLFLSNAKLNASLRMPMLRGVVQVLNSFHFLEDSVNEEKPATVEESDHDEDDDNDVEDEDEQVRQEVMQKAKEFKRAKISRVLETDIIPQLYAYINEDEKSGKKVLGIVDGKKGNLHSIANVRRQMEHENNAVTKNAILQLPVAIAIVKIAKHFSEEKFNLYVETLLDWLVKRLRTKNDKHRESARRILGIILQETGPAKLKFLIHKLKDNLVHGYQLHVLGYTVVTLLYQLYDPQNALVATPSHHGEKRAATSGEVLDPVQEVLTKREKKVHTEEADEPEEDNEAETKRKRLEMTEEERLALEEEEIINQLTNASGKTNFDFQFGVTCLTEIMDDLMLIFLDDYLGDIGHEKEQAELMSKMVEVKSNRAVQGFSFLAKHCQADRVMDGFLHRITWVLTPPSDGKSGLTANIAELHGSAKVRALLQRDMMNKYRNGSKNATADIVFVNKVRLLAVRVARNLMVNPTMDVEQSFRQVLRLVQKHNAVRDEKIAAFEAKDGTRRIRGNAHTVIHKAERKTYKEKLENTFLIPKTPDRVDLDFSSHTVLNTQQKTKLRVYKGRYGKELQEAAKDFYREDPTTAVVLDTVDEFLLKYLLSMLKHVLGIGKEKKYSKAAVQLDVLRKQKEKLVTQEEKEEPEEASDQEEAEENDEEAEDELDRFADAQELSTTKKGSKTKDLTMLFTEGHKEILEELVPAVLQTLKGEGSDAVVAMALDSLLALASLRPSLESVKSLGEDLFLTVLIFFERGGHIKQRAMRVCASVLSHSGFELSDDLAKRLVLLCRAEIVQRSTFLPVSLSLLYAVLGRHIMITEIYEMIDLVTELLVHMANKLNVRRLCVSVLVRFLTEYKMTAQKYKSHLELFVKNLDFPTLSGRLGLLDLLESLILHLPTVVLRQEVSLLFVPLSAMLTSCEWKEGREKAGQVMQLLATNAGLDVIAPLLSASLTPDNARPVRTMAMQTWATILLTLSSQLYTTVGGSKSAKKITEDDDEAVRIADPEDQQQFLSATGWSIPHILAGCCVDQYSAHKERLANQQKKRTGKAVKVDAIVLTGEEREKAELTGWTYVYYSLRCVESLVKAVPFVIYPLVAETLIPHLAHVLSGHAHRWVRGAAWRLLTHYFYTVVEEHMSILSEEVSPIAEEEGEESAANHLPYCVVCTGESTEVKDKMIKVFTQYASLTRSLLDRVAASDVKNEKYMAHEMMQDKGRTSLIKLMLFTTRATTRVALDMLTHLPADQEEVHAVIEKQFSTYDKQLAAVTGPVVKRGSVKGFMVRCATLCQYLGGAVSLLPRKEEDSDEAYLEKVTYLYGPTAMNLLPQLQKVILPFLFAVLHSATAEVSERLHGYAMNTIQLIERQIEERQAQLDQVPATTEKDVSPNSKKRKRPAETETAPAKRLKSDKGTTAPVKEGETAVSVRDILTLLQTGTAVSRNVKKEKLIRKETQKVLKRNRHERSKAK